MDSFGNYTEGSDDGKGTKHRKDKDTSAVILHYLLYLSLDVNSVGFDVFCGI